MVIYVQSVPRPSFDRDIFFVFIDDINLFEYGKALIDIIDALQLCGLSDLKALPALRRNQVISGMEFGGIGGIKIAGGVICIKKSQPS